MNGLKPIEHLSSDTHITWLNINNSDDFLSDEEYFLNETKLSTQYYLLLHNIIIIGNILSTTNDVKKIAMCISGNKYILEIYKQILSNHNVSNIIKNLNKIVNNEFNTTIIRYYNETAYIIKYLFYIMLACVRNSKDLKQLHDKITKILEFRNIDFNNGSNVFNKYLKTWHFNTLNHPCKKSRDSIQVEDDEHAIEFLFASEPYIYHNYKDDDTYYTGNSEKYTDFNCSSKYYLICLFCWLLSLLDTAAKLQCTVVLIPDLFINIFFKKYDNECKTKNITSPPNIKERILFYLITSAISYITKKDSSKQFACIYIIRLVEQKTHGISHEALSWDKIKADTKYISHPHSGKR